ncbi:MAG: ABC transporter substrate-binding protein [Anaerolineae bacterium]
MRAPSLVTLLLVIATAIIVTGCGAQPTATPVPAAQPTATPAPAAQPTATLAPVAQEIHWTIWAQTGSPAETELMQHINERFMAKHPGLTIELQTTADYVQQTNNLKLALPAGEGPDISYTQPGPEFTSKFGEADWIIDLQPYIEKYGIDKVVSQEMIRYFNTDSHGNFVENYALAWDVVVQGMYYNTETFDEEGLKPPVTREEWEDLLATLKEKGYTALCADGQDGPMFAMLAKYILHLNTDYEDLRALHFATGEANWDTPQVTQALQYMRDWYEAGYFEKDVLATGYEDSVKLFIDGKCAMLYNGTWSAGQMATDPAFKAGFFVLPPLNTDIPYHVAYTPNNAWIISSSTPDKDLAGEYIGFLYSEEVARMQWENSALPVRKFETVPDPVSDIQAVAYEATQKAGPGFWLTDPAPNVDEAWATIIHDVATGAVSVPEVQAILVDAYAKDLAGGE